jgi:hypothetical protein
VLDPILLLLLPWPFEASSCNLCSSYLSLLIVRAKMTAFELLFRAVVWLDWSGRLMPILQLFSAVARLKCLAMNASQSAGVPAWRLNVVELTRVIIVRHRAGKRPHGCCLKWEREGVTMLAIQLTSCWCETRDRTRIHLERKNVLIKKI